MGLKDRKTQTQGGKCNVSKWLAEGPSQIVEKVGTGWGSSFSLVRFDQKGILLSCWFILKRVQNNESTEGNISLEKEYEILSWAFMVSHIFDACQAIRT